MSIAERDYWNDDRYRPKSKKAPKWSFGVIGFILLALFASGLPMKIYNEINIHQEQKIRSYLQEREQYLSSSDQSFKQLMTKITASNGNLSSLTIDIHETNMTLTQNYQKLIDLRPPRAFKELHDKTIELYVIKQAAVDFLVSSANTNTYHSEILSTYIEESNRKMSELRPLMIEGLQKADMRYRIEQDGTLKYWAKDHFSRSLE
ncbi:hypothetical protein FGG79_02945 [Bacillus sp. BHET2]|uniref:hypothetical protein n=1 Tax=Bacillus sp. BHET2 TaxID=2583818 RepID=UPI00110DA80C|nr:hypothetical protein [Bacillus sp. BHET2]TMU87112.1 hypothetical protein FGG79_02945 [Bacillus sp. BHET2]